MPIRSFAQAALGAVFALSASFAHAGLLGTTISQCANTAYTGAVTVDTAQCDVMTIQPNPSTAVVGSGTEFNIAGTRFFDFDDATLTITYVQPVGSDSPDLIIFSFADLVGDISLVGANTLDVSWMVSGNLAGILVSAPLVDGTVTLRLNANEVPEPSSVMLVGLALFALASVRRKVR